MNGSKHKPLSGGSGAFTGSIEGKIVIILVLVVVVLGAVTFALYSANKSQEQDLKDKQTAYDAVSANLSQVSADYAALNTNYNRQTEEYNAIKENYDNVSGQYNALLNRSSLVDSRLNSYLENDFSVAYSYKVVPKVLPDNTTDQLLTITAYNVGKSDVPLVNVVWTINESGNLVAYNKTFSFVRTLDKKQVTWEFGKNDTLVNVWAGLG